MLKTIDWNYRSTEIYRELVTKLVELKEAGYSLLYNCSLDLSNNDLREIQIDEYGNVFYEDGVDEYDNPYNEYVLDSHSGVYRFDCITNGYKLNKYFHDKVVLSGYNICSSINTIIVTYDIHYIPYKKDKRQFDHKEKIIKKVNIVIYMFKPPYIEPRFDISSDWRVSNLIENRTDE